MIVRGMGKIPLENIEGKKARAVLFARNPLPERRFGFWETKTNLAGNKIPPPVFGVITPAVKESFDTLLEIQDYAGRIVKLQHSFRCKICKEVKGPDVPYAEGEAWFGEYVFAPLEGGYLYRWSEGVMHYHREHGLQEPHWMAVLVKEFKMAKSRGFWVD